jgi:transglutaminase-like putative cysteine protease
MLDSPERDRIDALAREWAADYPSGYRQVAAIVSHLRSGEFTLDSASAVPAECNDSAAHFLLRSRRGSDYLFASSAAVLLRSLG